MYNVNYVLAKALQQDQLREARKRRISRLWAAWQKRRMKRAAKNKARTA
jgi:hypothetical protein